MTGSQSAAARHPTVPPRAVPGSTEPRSRTARPGSAALAAGVGLGFGDLLAQRFVGYPWADLANSPALWAAAAFLVGWWVRSRASSVAAGVGSLVIAVVSYYLTAAVLLGDDVANILRGPAVFWYTGAVVTGSVAGLAGALCRSPVTWQVSWGAAVVPALLLGEASFHVRDLLAAVAAAWTLGTLALLTWRCSIGAAARAAVAIVLLAVAARVAMSVVGLHGLSH